MNDCKPVVPVEPQLSLKNLPIKLAHFMTANQENMAQMLIYMVRCDGLLCFWFIFFVFFFQGELN